MREKKGERVLNTINEGQKGEGVLNIIYKGKNVSRLTQMEWRWES